MSEEKCGEKPAEKSEEQCDLWQQYKARVKPLRSGAQPAAVAASRGPYRATELLQNYGDWEEFAALRDFVAQRNNDLPADQSDNEATVAKLVNRLVERGICRINSAEQAGGSRQQQTRGRGGGNHSAKSWKRSYQQIDVQLDLHGMTLNEADAALRNVVQFAHLHDQRMLLVISGKGQQYSQNGRPGEGGRERGRGRGSSGELLGDRRPTIREMMPAWLNSMSNLVIEFSQAESQDGGSGAWYILLRRRRPD